MLGTRYGSVGTWFLWFYCILLFTAKTRCNAIKNKHHL